MEDNGLVVDSNGVPEHAGVGLIDDRTAGSSGSGVNHGWQKVTNLKKSKRQDPRSKGQLPGASSENGRGDTESKIFKALEKESEERRARREALIQAAANAASAGSNMQSDSDLEGDDEYQPETNETSNGELKKPKAKKPKKHKVSVAEAASAIDPSNLAAFLTEISESFSELPNVQLMRFADYFGRAFNAVAPAQFGWQKILKESSVAKAVEIPLCYVPESVNKIASEWLLPRPVDALGDFIMWALNDVLNDTQPQQGTHKGPKGLSNHVATKSKVAVLVVLALALRKRPDALLQKGAAVKASHSFQGQEKLATLAWAYGQAAQGDLVVGMQLWVQNLLPLACAKNSTPAARDIALQFAESILFANMKKACPILQNGALRRGERLVPPAALDSLMHASYPSDVTRTKATDRFLAIYPLVKELALAGANRSKNLKTVAQQLLPLCLEAASEDVPALAHEASDTFVWCLTQNMDCFKQWEKLYLENLKGSVQVLTFLCCQWGKVAGQLILLEDLRNTINILRLKNHASMEKAKGDAKLYSLLKSADQHCKVLRKRLARPGVCFKVTATLIASASIVYGLFLLKLDTQLLR